MVQAQAQARARARALELVLEQVRLLHQVQGPAQAQKQVHTPGHTRVPGLGQDPEVIKDEDQALGQAKGMVKVQVLALALDLVLVMVKDMGRALVEEAALVKDQAMAKVMAMVKARGVETK